jgi:hypothetical protein
VQQPAQPVLRFGSLSHQRLAVARQQLQLAGRVVLRGRWQLRVSERGPAIGIASMLDLSE